MVLTGLTAEEYYKTLPQPTLVEVAMRDLDYVYREFNNHLCEFGRVVIAGGAVRDALLGRTPKDYDVFVLNTYTRHKDLAPKIIERLNTPQWIVQPVLPDVDSDKKDYEGRVAANINYYGKIVQIITNQCLCLESLIDTFDWKICMYGYDGHVISKYPINQVGPGKELLLNTVNTPINTLRRGFRFSERFQMKIPDDVILMLCAKVLAMDKNGKKRAEHMEFLRHLQNGAGDRN